MLLGIALGIFRNSHGTLFVAADPDAYSRRYPGMDKVVGNLPFTMGYRI